MQIRGAGGTEFQVLGAATPKLAVPNVLCMMFTRKRRYDPSWLHVNDEDDDCIIVTVVISITASAAEAGTANETSPLNDPTILRSTPTASSIRRVTRNPIKTRRRDSSMLYAHAASPFITPTKKQSTPYYQNKMIQYAETGPGFAHEARSSCMGHTTGWRRQHPIESSRACLWGKF